MRLASRGLWVRVPVEKKSLSEKGGAVELNVVGMACGIRESFYFPMRRKVEQLSLMKWAWQAESEEVSTVGHL